MKFRHVALLITILGVAVGCNPNAEPEKVVQAKDAAVKTKVDDSAPQGSSYRIEPPNKNDPRFKPDPKLAGGG